MNSWKHALAVLCRARLSSSPANSRCSATALLLVLAVMTSSLSAATYYVSPTGSDSNPGSQELPWKTIQKAAQVAKAGDTVIVLPGTYQEAVDITAASGQPGQPIIFRAQGEVILLGDWNVGTYSVPRHYITISGFHFRDAGMTLRGDFNVVENCVFEGPAGGLGISWHPTADPPSANVIVRGNQFRDFGQVVVMNTGAKTTNVIIENNTWENIEGDVLRLFGQGHVFRNNVVRGLTETGFHADIFQVYDNNNEPSLDMLIEKNQFLDSTGSLCMVLNRGASAIGNWEWRNNLIVNVAGVCQIAAPYFKFYNNTFVNSGTNTAGPILLRYYGDSEYAFAHDTIIKNNIFVGCSSYPDGEDLGWYHFADRPESAFIGFAADYNLVAKSGAAGYAPKSGFAGREVHGINGNPRFVNPGAYDFRLQADSPAVDSGVSIAGFSDAFDGTSRPQGAAWDRGAYERAGSGTESNPPEPPGNLRIRPVP